MVFTKRTQLKNVEVSRNEWVGGKSELGSFCKKRQKTGNNMVERGQKEVVFGHKRTQK
jgi:hypothetical protein